MVDEHGERHPALLTKSDKVNGRLVLWNYSANLLMKAEVTVVQVHQYLSHSDRHLVHVLRKFQVAQQPAEETVDFDDENYRLLEPAAEVSEASAPAAALAAA